MVMMKTSSARIVAQTDKVSVEQCGPTEGGEGNCGGTATGRWLGLSFVVLLLGLSACSAMKARGAKDPEPGYGSGAGNTHDQAVAVKEAFRRDRDNARSRAEAKGTVHCGVRPTGFGYLDGNGTFIAPPIYEAVMQPLVYGRSIYARIEWSKGLPVRLRDRWGYLGLDGRLKISPSFDEAGFFLDGRAIVGVIPDNLREFAPKEGEEWAARSGLIRRRRSMRWGYIDPDGKFVVEPRFMAAQYFNEGVAAVCCGGTYADDTNAYFGIENGKWGYIDRDGNMVIAPRFTFARAFWNGFAGVAVENKAAATTERVRNQWKWNFIDHKGVILCDQHFDDVANFENGMAPVMCRSMGRVRDRDTGEYWGYVDEKGKLVIPCQYQDALPFHEGAASVSTQGKWRLIDKRGRAIGEATYDNIQSFLEGLAAFKRNEKWGFLSSRGVEVIAPEYDEVGGFREGLAAVRRGTLWGYVDRNGKIVIPLRFTSADGFVGGLAAVSLPYDWPEGSGRAYINRSGIIVQWLSGGGPGQSPIFSP